MADLTTEMNAQPAKEQTVEDRAVDVTDARTALRTAATTVDRLNKRFYAKLEAEARTNRPSPRRWPASPPPQTSPARSASSASCKAA